MTTDYVAPCYRGTSDGVESQSLFRACTRIIVRALLACARAICAWCAIAAWSTAKAVSITSSPEELKRLSLEELTDIVVTSVSKRPEKLSQTPSAIQVITSEEIRRSGATSIPEVLRLADNLDVAQVNSHDWAISARGFNTALANKLLVLIDGRTVYTPLFSGVFWNAQDYLLADIDHIEVISGPGGTLWGANAVNGVINIITKSAKDTPGGYVEGGGGTQLQDFAGARYGFTPAAGVYARVYAKYFDRGNELRGDGADVSDSWRMRQGGFRVDAEPSKTDAVTLQGDLYGSDVNVPTGGLGHASGDNLLGRWSHVQSEAADFSVQMFYDRTHLRDPITNQFAVAQILTDDLDTFDIDFLQHLRLGAAHQVTWGLGYRRTRDDVGEASNLAFLPARLEQSLYSGFVQDEIALPRHFALTLGTKIEHNDYTGLDLEPSVRLQWTGEAQMFWGAISRAVRTPSRVDRDVAEPAPSTPPVILAGGRDFASEILVAYEAGYRAQLGANLNGSLAAFYNDYYDLRSTSLTPGTIVPLFFENNLQGRTYGIELSVNYEIETWWRLHGGYDPIIEHVEVKPGRFDLNHALNETADPHARLSLRSAMDLPANIEFDAALRWVDDRLINNGRNVGSVPDYLDLDLRLGWRPNERLEFSLAGQNLLHAQHPEYGFPGPGQYAIQRNLYGKIVWHF